MKSINKYIVILGCSFAFNSVQAQLQDNQTDLLRPFQAKLAQSKKFESVPHMPKLDTNSNKNQNYVVPTHLMSVNYPAPSIRPLAMPSQNFSGSAIDR